MLVTRFSWVVVLMSIACWAQAGSQADDEAKKKVEEFRQAYKSGEESARAGAVSALAQTYASSVTKVLVGVLAADPSVSVREAAAAALGRPADDVAVAGLAAAIDPNKKSPEVLSSIAKALAECNSDRAAEVLHTMFSHVKDQVAQDAVNAAGKIASPASIPPLLALLRKAEQERDVADTSPNSSGFTPTQDQDLIRLIEPCMEALKLCAGGSDGGVNFKQWDSWWKKSQGTLQYAQVFWCPGTRQTFEVKPGEKKLCPFDGDHVKGCGVLLKRKAIARD